MVKKLLSGYGDEGSIYVEKTDHGKQYYERTAGGKYEKLTKADVEFFTQDSWEELPLDVRDKITKRSHDEHMSENIPETKWNKSECKLNGGIWVESYYKDGKKIPSYCRRR
jgi:hypothetical protein